MKTCSNCVLVLADDWTRSFYGVDDLAVKKKGKTKNQMEEQIAEDRRNLANFVKQQIVAAINTIARNERLSVWCSEMRTFIERTFRKKPSGALARNMFLSVKMCEFSFSRLVPKLKKTANFIFSSCPVLDLEGKRKLTADPEDDDEDADDEEKPKRRGSDRVDRGTKRNRDVSVSHDAPNSEVPAKKRKVSLLEKVYSLFRHQ